MGFLEIAAAFKFISNTDLVWQWDIFTYEVVLSCWAIIIMALCSLYIVGYIRFKNDSKVNFSYQRCLLSIVFFLYHYIYYQEILDIVLMEPLNHTYLQKKNILI